MKNHKNILILLAGGSGTRCNPQKPKQFVKVLGKTILEHTLDNVANIDFIDEIYLVCHSNYIQKITKYIHNYPKIKMVVQGGETRGDSIKKGIESVPYADEKTKVLIHDSVRPLISRDVIDKIIKLLEKYDVVQTVTSPNTDIIIGKTFYCRDKVKLCSGPEAGRLGILKRAYELNPSNSVLEACSSITKKISTIDANYENIKVTYSADILLLKEKLKNVHITKLI